MSEIPAVTDLIRAVRLPTSRIAKSVIAHVKRRWRFPPINYNCSTIVILNRIILYLSYWNFYNRCSYSFDTFSKWWTLFVIYTIEHWKIQFWTFGRCIISKIWITWTIRFWCFKKVGSLNWLASLNRNWSFHFLLWFWAFVKQFKVLINGRTSTYKS